MRSWFITAVVCCALSCSTSKAAEATNDYILNKPYKEVIQQVVLNNEQIHERLNTTILKTGEKINSLFYSANHGFYVGQSKTILVEVKTPDGYIKATVNCKALFREDQMRIEVDMEPNDYLKSHSMVMVFEPDENGSKTKVHSSLDFKAHYVRNPIFENAYKRVYLRRLERIIRDIVDDPLPEKDDE